MTPLEGISGFLRGLDLPWILQNCWFSLSRVAVGVGAAVAAGVAFGLLRSALPPPVKRNRLVKLLFDAPKFPPPIAWIPFVIIWLGIGEVAAYAIVFIGAFSPTFTAAYEGAEAVPLAIRRTARSMGIAGWRYLARISLPASLPQIFTGIRLGISMGWMSIIAAEMVSGQSGLGYSIQLNRLNMQYGLMTLDMVLIGLIGFFLFEGAVLLQRLFLPWKEEQLT